MKTRFLRAFHLLEIYILSFVLTGLITISCLQIFLRLVFDQGIFWGDQLQRYLVVWGGFLGAVFTVSQGKHIALDLSKHLFPKRFITTLRRITHFFSAAICSLLCYGSFRFIQDEIAFGGTTFLMVPSWCWNLIFPCSFFLMGLKYLLLAMNLKLFSKAQELEEKQA